jgi:hypothetical protein
MEPILNLSPQEFRAALAELQLDPQREADLMRQYRRANSPFAPIYGLLDRATQQDAEQSTERASMLPVSRPKGMSVADAVRSGQAQFAMPQGLLDAIGGTFLGIDAPAAAYQGVIPSEDMTSEGFGTAAVSMGFGGLLGSAPQDAVGMFAGRRARTADLSALRRAERMSEQGASRDDIFRETGWFQGSDDQWRFEIDDTPSHMRPEASALAGERISLGEGFSHMPLRHAYPDLFDPTLLDYRYDVGSTAARFKMGERGFPASVEVRGPQEADMRDARLSTLHELQHAVQSIEGWRNGGNTALTGPVGRLMEFRPSGQQILDAIRSGDQSLIRDFRARLPEGFDAYERMNQFFPNASADDIIAAIRPRAEIESYGRYERIPGEQESRLTEARADMTGRDRRAVAPWETRIPFYVSRTELEDAQNYLAQFGLLAP